MPIAKVGDIDIYYEEHGSGDPLLLIMGLAADSLAWLFQLPEFSKYYRTIVFDNRGVGRSSKPAGPYSIHQMADDAAGLLDLIGITRTHVVGVSMGGMIAQELALRHSQRVRSLVLGCTYPQPDADIERARVFSVSALGGHVAASGNIEIDLKSVEPMQFFQTLLPVVFNPEFLEKERPKLIELFRGALHYGFSLEAIFGQMAAVMSHKATERLHQITVPTLVITGDAHRLVPPANSDILAKHIPNAKLVKVSGGSHGFNFETPDVFNREVLAFLASIAS